MGIAGISANRLELLQIADAVAREKSIDRKIVIQAMEDAIQKAANEAHDAEAAWAYFLRLSHKSFPDKVSLN